jgi:conjugative relaxase-like TrwC/TraI family protein
VLSIGLVGHGRGAADYYLTRQAGSAIDYYTGAGERSGYWAGSGAEALGLGGVLDPAGEQVLRGLLAGTGPDNLPLVGQVRRADPRARVPAAPLVAAVRAAATAAGLPPGVFLPPGAAAEFARVARGLTRATRRTAGVRADVAVRVATAAGLDARAIYAAAAPDHPGLLTDALTHVGERVDARRAGLDLTFSAPKSVSLLFAFGDPATVAAVRAAHQTAIGQALAYLEEVAGHGVRGHHGDGRRAQQVTTDGLIGVGFEHRTSRAMDPQLHTHLVVPNLVHGADGQWSARDTRALHRHARTAGYLYQAVLRGQLTQTLGVGWGSVRRGQADLVGIPAAALRVFSTRRAQIDEQLEAAGTSGGRAAQVACLTTRPPKPRPQPLPGDGTGAIDGAVGLRDLWARRAADAGLHPDRIVRDALTASHGSALGTDPEDRRPLLARLTQALLGPAGLTEHATSFDRADVLRGLCEHLPPGTPASHDELQHLADHVLSHPAAVPLTSGRTKGGAQGIEAGPSARWTTRELLAVEARALTLAEHLATTPDPGMDPDWVEQRIEESTLTAEQRDMVRDLTAPGGSLRLVIGPAGSGKTAALAVAYRAWRLQGRSVHGCALSALAARGLQTSTRIPSTSVAAMLNELENGRPHVQPGTVLIVDEAAMVGTRDLARLLTQAANRAMTLVLVGDPAQLPEIGAGGLFTHLTHHTHGNATTVLSGNQRQNHRWEQDALTQLRDGDIPAALDTYLAHHRVHITPDHQQLQDAVAADYLTWHDHLHHTDNRGGSGRVLVVAATRRHATQINTRIREHLTARGDLTGPQLDAGTPDTPLPLRAGDLVLVVANDHPRGLLNGEHAHITAVNVARAELTLTTPDQRDLTVDTAWAAGHLAHGYALTCHKAQGQTVDVTLVAGSAALTRETTYTALSRGRATNHLYLAPDTPHDPHDTSAQAWIHDHALADTSRHLATSRRQTLATDLTTRRRRPSPPIHPGADPPAIGF